ncbi:hypothetical protein [Streptomyces sp. NPDC050264]|uniref:hypothetical protein n=1 Tax=Streptomyces sp. NPDC050264 TaxID=3155038 RepID=UPI003420D9B4
MRADNYAPAGQEACWYSWRTPAWRADGGEHGTDPGLREDLVDDGGVFRVAVADHELDGGEFPGIFEVHDQVLDCLGDPGMGGVGGGPEHTDASVGVVDGGEDVLTLPGEGDGLDEVHREDRLGLGLQESGPGDVRALGCRVDAFGLEDFPDGGGRQLDAEEREFDVDAPVSPGWVFRGEAECEAADGGDGARAAGALVAAETDVTVIHEVAVPAQDSVRGDNEP